MASLRLPDALRIFEPTFRRLRVVDPLLMSAAIAYNFFFAIIPVAIAIVAVLSIVGRDEQGLARLTEALSALPPDVAKFASDVILEARDAVGGASALWIIIALLVALYSGSRGIYAIQKAIRAMQGLEETRPYWVTRGLGILLTIGTVAALAVGYLLVLLGGRLTSVLNDWGGVAALPLDWAVLPVLIAWLVGLFFIIYRWGTPEPISGGLLASIVTSALVVVGSWVAQEVIAVFGFSRTVSFLGTVGVLLLWFYYAALVVLVVPAIVDPLWQRYVTERRATSRSGPA